MSTQFIRDEQLRRILTDRAIEYFAGPKGRLNLTIRPDGEGRLSCNLSHVIRYWSPSRTIYHVWAHDAADAVSQINAIAAAASRKHALFPDTYGGDTADRTGGL